MLLLLKAIIVRRPVHFKTALELSCQMQEWPCHLEESLYVPAALVETGRLVIGQGAIGREREQPLFRAPISGKYTLSVGRRVFLVFALPISTRTEARAFD
jgi:hypothetical protein